MKKNKAKLINICVILACLAVLCLGIIFANKAEAKEHNPYYRIEYELARVTQVLTENYVKDETAEGALRGSQSLYVTILTGRYKGDVMPVNNYLGPMHQKPVKQGTVLTVMLTSDSREAGYQISIINYDFTWLLAIMLVLFTAAVIIVGRSKGLKSLVGLLVTIVTVVFFLIPMWLKGYPAVPLTLCVSLYVTVFCFTLLGGITRKTVSAMLGTALCVLLAGAFAFICERVAGVSGLTMNEAEWLLDESRTLGVVLNVRGLFVSGILISSLGAVMDVSMSIASSVTELRSVNPELTPKQLFRSGMNIGRDLIGTMTNTLILAFVGTSLNLMIIMFAAGMQPYQLINNDDMIMEVIRAIAGSIGLVLAVPLTAAVACAGRKHKA